LTRFSILSSGGEPANIAVGALLSARVPAPATEAALCCVNHGPESVALARKDELMASNWRPLLDKIDNVTAEDKVDNGGTTQVSLEPLPGRLLISVSVASDCSAGDNTVRASPDGVVKLDAVGIDRHLVKPVEMETVLGAIHALLEP
jgi:hypothetical protein